MLLEPLAAVVDLGVGLGPDPFDLGLGPAADPGDVLFGETLQLGGLGGGSTADLVDVGDRVLVDGRFDADRSRSEAACNARASSSRKR
jgi:hypothetical protein